MSERNERANHEYRAPLGGAADPGDPAKAIVRFAEEEGADLIVVGSRGMTGTRRFLVGSVPNKVSHHAPCDVIIVRTAD
jgi:nucleotide-binding universal stress UspA family protein